MKKIKSIQSE